MDDVFELYWKHFRTQLTQWWDVLAEHEVHQVNGKRENLIALLQAKYGYTQVECENMVRQKIDAFEQRHRNKLGSFIQARRNVPVMLERNSPDAAPLETLKNFNERTQMKPKASRHPAIDDKHGTQRIGTKHDYSL